MKCDLIVWRLALMAPYELKKALQIPARTEYHDGNPTSLHPYKKEDVY